MYFPSGSFRPDQIGDGANQGSEHGFAFTQGFLRLKAPAKKQGDDYSADYAGGEKGKADKQGMGGDLKNQGLPKRFRPFQNQESEIAVKKDKLKISIHHPEYHSNDGCGGNDLYVAFGCLGHCISASG